MPAVDLSWAALGGPAINRDLDFADSHLEQTPAVLRSDEYVLAFFWSFGMRLAETAEVARHAFFYNLRKTPAGKQPTALLKIQASVFIGRFDGLQRFFRATIFFALFSCLQLSWFSQFDPKFSAISYTGKNASNCLVLSSEGFPQAP